MNLTKQLFDQFGVARYESRIVKWSAPEFDVDGNMRGHFGGYALITLISKDDFHPLHTERISGDRLDGAFWDGDDLAYSDCGRYVDIKFMD